MSIKIIRFEEFIFVVYKGGLIAIQKKKIMNKRQDDFGINPYYYSERYHGGNKNNALPEGYQTNIFKISLPGRFYQYKRPAMPIFNDIDDLLLLLSLSRSLFCRFVI